LAIFSDKAHDESCGNRVCMPTTFQFLDAPPFVAPGEDIISGVIDQFMCPGLLMRFDIFTDGIIYLCMGTNKLSVCAQWCANSWCRNKIRVIPF
jgi:hypothetical protein